MTIVNAAFMIYMNLQNTTFYPNPTPDDDDHEDDDDDGIWVLGLGLGSIFATSSLKCSKFEVMNGHDHKLLETLSLSSKKSRPTEFK